MTTAENSGGSAQMPRYVGHKLVWALQIRSIEPMGESGARLTFHENFAPKTMPLEWMVKHTPQAGGFLVTYPDGYVSWSPEQPFKEGYVPAEEWGLRFNQEPKYTINAMGRLANRQTGIAIPDEEPVMVFRGKDVMMPAVMRFYASQLPPGQHRDDVERQIERVEAFQAAYSRFVRVPD